MVEKKVPEADQIIADASQPIGVISVSSAHIGYKAKLWKIVKENGVEVSREQVNSSNYKMSPRTANRWNCFSGSECDQPDAGGHCDQQH